MPNPNLPWVNYQIECINEDLDECAEIRYKAWKHKWTEVAHAFDKIIAHLNAEKAELIPQIPRFHYA